MGQRACFSHGRQIERKEGGKEGEKEMLKIERLFVGVV